MRSYKLFAFLLFSLILSGCADTSRKSDKNFPINDIANISITAQSYQLVIRESTDNLIHVKYTESNKHDSQVTVELSDNELIVSQHDSSDNGSILDGLSFGKTGEINLYIPESYSNPLNISNGSGELKLSSLSISELSISNDSGYITSENIESNEGILTSKSGDIISENSFIDSLKISTDSGYVSVISTESSNMDLHSNSGEISISDLVESCNTSIDNSSGDITISYKTLPTNLSFNIATNSDDISCKLENADYITNVSSNKKGTIGAGYYTLTVSSDEGTIIVQ